MAIKSLNLNGKFACELTRRHFTGEAYCLCRRALPCVVRVIAFMMVGGHGKQMKSIRG
ncbi:hypothetical protein [Rhizobium sp. UGM030330-04]|uniref:hypothetical protein n=1 Tax=Rhizobium sp. UGM030330-04 TaxID=1378077 RepID=UPI0015E8D212|nr:hypothetical protein [Rhizobium sp. UGM030330-04]